MVTTEPVKDADVSDDHLLLQDITEEHEITAPRLALAVGRGRSTVYRYLEGASTIPSIVWRWLWSATRDVRIVKLITGETPVVVVPLDEARSLPGKAAVQELIRQRKKQICCEELVLNMLEDGKIDRGDIKAIQEYRRVFPEMITHAHQLYYAVLQEFKESKEI